MAQKSRKIRALAAGGAVLGVGAAITLAAWTDNEFAIGDFATGSFNIQGAAGDSAFADHPENAPLELVFEGGDNLAPGEPVYNRYQLQNAGSVDAYINYTQTADPGITEELLVDLHSIPLDAECTAETFAEGTLIQEGAAGEFVLAEGGEGNYCFQVTLPEGHETLESESGNILWTFEANQEAIA